METPTYNAIMFSGFRRNAKFKLEIIHQNKRFQSFKTKVFRPSRKLRREVPDLWGSIFSPGRKVSKVRNMFPYEFAVISKFCKNGRVRLLRHNNKATSEAGEKTRCVTARVKSGNARVICVFRCRREIPLLRGLKYPKTNFCVLCNKGRRRGVLFLLRRKKRGSC